MALPRRSFSKAQRNVKNFKVAKDLERDRADLDDDSLVPERPRTCFGKMASVPNADTQQRNKLSKELAALCNSPALTLKKIDQNPKFKNDAFVLAYKATAYDKLGRPDLAIESYNKSLEVDPFFHATRLALAKLYMHQKEFVKARDHLMTAVKLGSESLACIKLLANVHYKCSDFTQAKSCITQAMRASPNDIYMRYILGKITFKEENYEGAKVIFQTIKRDNPDHVNAQVFLDKIAVLQSQAQSLIVRPRQQEMHP